MENGVKILLVHPQQEDKSTIKSKDEQEKTEFSLRKFSERQKRQKEKNA